MTMTYDTYLDCAHLLVQTGLVLILCVCVCVCVCMCVCVEGVGLNKVQVGLLYGIEGVGLVCVQVCVHT
jgi:hypothetical protein